MSRYAICKAIGFSQSAMSRFMNGHARVSLEVLDKLAEVIGLEIASKPTPERGKKG